MSSAGGNTRGRGKGKRKVHRTNFDGPTYDIMR